MFNLKLKLRGIRKLLAYILKKAQILPYLHRQITSSR